MKILLQYHQGDTEVVEVDVEKEYVLDHILNKKGWMSVKTLKGVGAKVNLDWVAVVIPLDENGEI